MFTIRWTERAKHDVESICDFILIHWDSKIECKFLDLMEQTIDLIRLNPKRSIPTNHFTNARKIIVHPHVTLYYAVDEEKKEIILLSFFDTRQNPNKLK